MTRCPKPTSRAHNRLRQPVHSVTVARMSLPEAADHLPEDFFTELFNEPAATLSPAEAQRLRGPDFLPRLLDHLPGLVSYFDHHLVCHYANRAQLRHLPSPADSATSATNCGRLLYAV